jgi:uncharacterized membrane protein|tara:strand:+ start:530 stop:799 length:270 start_codon:yes stop_codon:yes gene_type:complete
MDIRYHITSHRVVMIELKEGMFRVVKRIIGQSSIGLAVIYTLGHIIIAMICNYIITGATLELAAIDALVEPIINGFWFYLLHKGYKAWK